MNTSKQQTVLFHALGHPIRLQILEILSQGPRCVCDIVALTGKRQPYISQSLSTLSDAGLVTTERQGCNIFYRLNYLKLIGLQATIAALSQPKQDHTKDETIILSNFNNLCRGIPRAEIPWCPTINPELCNGCQLCIYACPEDAITFPDKDEVVDQVKQLRLKYAG